tara:strand:+ start:148 stop:525 length:378 start_codon:yes stop_codon:yes gene_type:complete
MNVQIIIPIIISAISVIAYLWQRSINAKERESAKLKYNKLLSQKKQSEVRLGQIAEHLVPLLDPFPYDPKKAQFLGSPIDFVVFEDNVISFVEVKTGRSQLTKKQRNIKRLVENKQVEWTTIRLK